MRPTGASSSPTFVHFRRGPNQHLTGTWECVRKPNPAIAGISRYHTRLAVDPGRLSLGTFARLAPAKSPHCAENEFGNRPRRSPGSVYGRFLGARAGPPGGRGGNVRKSARTRREWGERPNHPAGRVDGQSLRIFRKSRETPAIAGFAIRGHSRRMGVIKRRLARNAQKSAKTTLEWGEWPQNRAGRIDAQSHMIFRIYQEIPAVAGFGLRAPSRCEIPMGGGGAGPAEMCESRR